MVMTGTRRAQLAKGDEDSADDAKSMEDENAGEDKVPTVKDNDESLIAAIEQ